MPEGSPARAARTTARFIYSFKTLYEVCSDTIAVLELLDKAGTVQRELPFGMTDPILAYES
jgi:hypothetical protein